MIEFEKYVGNKVKISKENKWIKIRFVWGTDIILLQHVSYFT